MTTAGFVFAAIAVALHVYIWVLESYLWTSDSTIRKFGISKAQAEQTKQLAYNQGFYNLFLAVIAAVGLIFLLREQFVEAGWALVTAGLGSMVAAGLVLALNDRRKLRPAITQLTSPLLALLFLYLA
jgi:putative membrane protein